MNREQYQAWADHPQTKQFFQYLKDYRSDVMEKWAQGQIGLGWPDKVRGAEDNIAAISRCQMADEIANLEDTAIEEFYKNRKVEVKDAE